MPHVGHFWYLLFLYFLWFLFFFSVSVSFSHKIYKLIYNYFIIASPSAADMNLNMFPPHTTQVPLAEYLPFSFLVTTGSFISRIVGLLLVLHFIHKAISVAILLLIKPTPLAGQVINISKV